MKFLAALTFVSQILSTGAQAQIALPPHDHFTASSKDNVTVLTLKEEGQGELFALARKITAAGVASVGSAESKLLISCKQHPTSLQYGVVTECKFEFVDIVAPPVQYLTTSKSVSRFLAPTHSVLGLELLAPAQFNLSNSYGQHVLIKILPLQTLISFETMGFTR